jgi:hypothetical protein
MPNHCYLRCLLFVYLRSNTLTALPPVYCDLPIADAIIHLVGYDTKELCLSIVNHSPSDTYFRCHLLVPMPDSELTLLVPCRLFVVIHSLAPVSQTVVEVLKPMSSAPALNLSPGFLPSRTVMNRAIPISLVAIAPILSVNFQSTSPSPLDIATLQTMDHSEHMTSHSDEYCTLFDVTPVHFEHINQTSIEYLSYLSHLTNLYNHFNRNNSLRASSLPLISHSLSDIVNSLNCSLSAIRPREVMQSPLSRSYYINSNVSSACFFSLTSDPADSVIPHSVDTSEPTVPTPIRLIPSDPTSELTLPISTQLVEPAYPSIERKLAALPFSPPDDIYLLITPTASQPDGSLVLISEDLVPILCNRLTSQIRSQFAITFARLYLTILSILTQSRIESLIQNRPIPLSEIRLSPPGHDDPLALALHSMSAKVIAYHLPVHLLRFLSSYTHPCGIGLFCPLNAIVALSQKIEFSEYLLFLDRRFPRDADLRPVLTTLDGAFQASENDSETSSDSSESHEEDPPLHPPPLVPVQPQEQQPLMRQIMQRLRLRGNSARHAGQETISFHMTASTLVPDEFRHTLASFLATIIFVCFRYLLTMLTPRPTSTPQSPT